MHPVAHSILAAMPRTQDHTARIYSSLREARRNRTRHLDYHQEDTEEHDETEHLHGDNCHHHMVEHRDLQLRVDASARPIPTARRYVD